MHIRAKTKPWDWGNWLQNSETGLCRIWGRPQTKILLKFGTTRTLPRADHLATLSNWERRALVREVTENLMVTLAELPRSCLEMGETYRRTTITGTLHRSGLSGRAARHKPVFSERHIKPGTAHYLHNTVPTVKHGGGNIMRQSLEDWSGLRESWTEQSTEISLLKTWSRALRISDWAKGSPSNRTMTLSTQAKQRRSDLGTTLWMSLNCQAGAPTWTQSIKHICNLKMAVHWRSPSNLTELEKVCREEWQKIHVCKASTRGWHDAEGASTKYWVKVLNTCVNLIFHLFSF